MNIAISNIAWSKEHDAEVYSKLQQLGITGLEIAPTRIFKENPYERINAAKEFARLIKYRYALSIPSMQSIWYGRQERIWGAPEERYALLEYTKRAIDFASAIGCKNLVFGCPKNRIMPPNADIDVAIRFFNEIGNYAFEKDTCIGMEANPTIYNTNFLNTTAETINFIRLVDSKGFRLNLDIGTMIYNRESIDVLDKNGDLINHIHISEPGLSPIKKRTIHSDIIRLITEISYRGYISIEMNSSINISDLFGVLNYVIDLLN